MRTKFVTPEKYEKIFLELAEKTDTNGTKRPERFKKIMKTNRASIQAFSPFGKTDDGLEPKNPLIVALGDSVTAGFFEFGGDPREIFKKGMEGKLTEDDVVAVPDARVCYLEKFREKLIDYYEQTSPSVINSGISGDSVIGMEKRLERDVIRYQPDLVIINGSLNWDEQCGSTDNYRKILTRIVERIQAATEADMILMTPNAEIPGPISNPLSSLEERVQVIRALAEEKQVCLADAYKVWTAYKEAGYPLEEMLANGMNHPSVTGHEAFAEILMKLIRQ